MGQYQLGTVPPPPPPPPPTTTTTTPPYHHTLNTILHVVYLLFHSGATALTTGFTNGAGVIWLDDVQCRGTETRLIDCPAQPLGTHNCGHVEDAGVRCQGKHVPILLLLESTVSHSFCVCMCVCLKTCKLACVFCSLLGHNYIVIIRCYFLFPRVSDSEFIAPRCDSCYNHSNKDYY